MPANLASQTPLLQTSCGIASANALVSMESPDKVNLFQQVSIIANNTAQFCSSTCLNAVINYQQILVGTECKNFSLTNYSLTGEDAALLVDAATHIVCSPSVDSAVPCYAVENQLLSNQTSVVPLFLNVLGGLTKSQDPFQQFMALINTRPVLCSKCTREQFNWLPVKLPTYLNNIIGPLAAWIKEEISECSIKVFTSTVVVPATTTLSVVNIQTTIPRYLFTKTIFDVTVTSSCPKATLAKRDIPLLTFATSTTVTTTSTATFTSISVPTDISTITGSERTTTVTIPTCFEINYITIASTISKTLTVNTSTVMRYASTFIQTPLTTKTLFTTIPSVNIATRSYISTITKTATARVSSCPSSTPTVHVEINPQTSAQSIFIATLERTPTQPTSTTAQTGTSVDGESPLVKPRSTTTQTTNDGGQGMVSFLAGLISMLLAL